jgi:hypothetical protein
MSGRVVINHMGNVARALPHQRHLGRRRRIGLDQALWQQKVETATDQRAEGQIAMLLIGRDGGTISVFFVSLRDLWKRQGRCPTRNQVSISPFPFT